MNKIKNMIWFVMLGLYFSCSSTGSAPQKSSAYTVDFEEDLSVYRTSYDYKTGEEGFATEAERPAKGQQPEQMVSVNTDLTVTKDLDKLLEEAANKNKSIKTLPGYTIQVFSGNNREKADQVKRQVYHVLPESRPEINFSPPNWKVRVGQYVERLEAQKAFSELKKEFPNAIIIPDRIQINN